MVSRAERNVGQVEWSGRERSGVQAGSVSFAQHAQWRTPFRRWCALDGLVLGMGMGMVQSESGKWAGGRVESGNLGVTLELPTSVRVPDSCPQLRLGAVRDVRGGLPVELGTVKGDYIWGWDSARSTRGASS